MEENKTVTTGSTEESGKTFTQADVDALISERLARAKAKYADYDDLKSKAAQFDELQEANKSELQKANEKAQTLQKELDQMRSANALRETRAKVAQEMDVPVNLLTGTDEEACKKQAEAILDFAGKGKKYPGTKKNNSNKQNSQQESAESAAMRAFARQIFGTGE